jgi:MFS family permease
MYWGLLSWLPSYLKIVRGFTWMQMGALASLPYALGTILLIVSGFLMFRIRKCSVFLWSGPFVYGIAMTFAITSNKNLISALWMAVAMGGICWAFGASFVVLQKIISSEIIARATGLLQGIAQIAGGFAPYLIGWLIAINNGSYTAGFGFLIIISLLCSFTYFILYLREGRTFGIVDRGPTTSQV